MKNNGLIIALIIILSIIIFGLVMLLVFGLNGNYRFLNIFRKIWKKKCQHII